MKPSSSEEPLLKTACIAMAVSFSRKRRDDKLHHSRNPNEVEKDYLLPIDPLLKKLTAPL
jgi:hypothetical protein